MTLLRGAVMVVVVLAFEIMRGLSLWIFVPFALLAWVAWLPVSIVRRVWGRSAGADPRCWVAWAGDLSVLAFGWMLGGVDEDFEIPPPWRRHGCRFEPTLGYLA